MLNKLAVMTLVLVTPLALQAQGPGGPGRPGGPGFGGLGFGGPRPFFGIGGPGGAPVMNQPYAAVETSSDTIKNREGKTVTHSSQEQKWRDAAGRTRSEVSEPAEGKRPAIHRAEIFDPVAHTATTLDFNRKIAIVRQLPPPREGRGPRPPQNGGPRQPRTPPGVTITTTELPAKTIAGVYATGKETTRTVAAGTHGNTQPIVDTDEVYVSPDLKIVLYASNNGPRGNSLHQVTSLNRADPNEVLFEVPAGFTVKNAPQHAGRGGFGGPRGPRGPGGPGGPPPAAE